MNLNTGSHRDVFVYKSKYISKKKKNTKGRNLTDEVEGYSSLPDSHLLTFQILKTLLQSNYFF